MNYWELKEKEIHKISFGLKSGVKCHILPNEQPVLLLNFPLKIIYINRFWKPVIDCFVKNKEVPFKKICQRAREIEPARIESFLNELVSDGFIFQKGIYIPSEYPVVSVIIPTGVKEDDLLSCLGSLKKLEYPDDKLEIILVGNLKTAKTEKKMSGFSRINFIKSGEILGSAAIKNLGASRAKGEILAFIEPHSIVHAMWLKELVPAFADDTIGAVGGLIDLYYEISELDHYIKNRTAREMGKDYGRSSGKRSFIYLPPSNLLVKKELFSATGGFREDLKAGEEIDFYISVQDMGKRLEYRPVGKVFQKPRNRFLTFCKHAFNLGASEPLIQEKHPDRIKRFFLAANETVFWISLFFSVIFGSYLLLGLCLTIFLSDFLSTYIKILRRRIPVNVFFILTGIMRCYFSFLCYFSNFISRHYFLPALFLMGIFPLLSGGVIFLHILSGVTDYWIMRPYMSQVGFMFYFTLDNILYQAGLWWGAIKYSRFNLIFPKLISTNEREEFI